MTHNPAKCVLQPSKSTVMAFAETSSCEYSYAAAPGTNCCNVRIRIYQVLLLWLLVELDGGLFGRHASPLKVIIFCGGRRKRWTCYLCSTRVVDATEKKKEGSVVDEVCSSQTGSWCWTLGFPSLPVFPINTLTGIRLQRLVHDVMFQWLRYRFAYISYNAYIPEPVSKSL